MFRTRVILVLIGLCAATPAHAGNVVSWGANSHAQLGAGYKSRGSDVPVASLIANARNVVTGGEWGAALLENGTVETWGGNESGQGGNGTITPYKALPSVVAGLSGVVELAGSGEHWIARLNDGSVVTDGSNLKGQDCNGQEGQLHQVTRPYKVPGITTAKQVAAGGAVTEILLDDGTVVGCGENHHGELGDGTLEDKTHPARSKNLTGITQVSVNGAAIVGQYVEAVTLNGQVLALGLNDYGQLGNGATGTATTPTLVKNLSNVREVSAGFDHSLAILNDGTVVGWGQDAAGQLGQTKPASSCGGPHRQLPCQLTPIPVGINEATTVDASVHFSLIVKDSMVYGMGANQLGTLGDGNTNNTATPTLIQGLSGVTSITGGPYNGYAIATTHPRAILEAIPGPATITVTWTSTDTKNGWHVAIRSIRTPALPFNELKEALPPTTRQHVYTGLATGEYEVLVTNKTYGHRIATAAITTGIHHHPSRGPNKSRETPLVDPAVLFSPPLVALS